MRLAVILLLFIASCKPAPVQESEVVDSIDFSSMNLQQTNMTLVDNAQKKALDWTAIQDLFTALENYDHSIGTTVN
jgi:PBP1b-binding outer membrane lipoprotein LpoB